MTLLHYGPSVKALFGLNTLWAVSQGFFWPSYTMGGQSRHRLSRDGESRHISASIHYGRSARPLFGLDTLMGGQSRPRLALMHYGRSVKASLGLITPLLLWGRSVEASFVFGHTMGSQ